MRRRPLGLLLALVLLGLTPLPVGASAEAPAPQGADYLTGPNEGDPDDIAIAYFQQEAAEYGLSASDVSDLTIRSSYTSKHTGVTHVNINQQFQGLEVFGADTTVNIARDGSVLFVGGTSVSGLAAAATAVDTDATEAVAAAADALGLEEPTGLRVLSSAAEESVVSSGGISDATIPAKLGWQPTESGLRKAWQLVIDETGDSHLWNATVDAATGELLAVDDWTDHDNIADLTSTLGQSATSGYSARFVFAASSTPTVVTPNPVNDGSSYLVLPLPKESPNDGPFSVVENPADATASPFGWHDTDGLPGPEFTTTQGNNVHAYMDQDANNQADFGSDPDGGAGLDFIFPPDLGEHAQDYRDTATTNLFYWNNIYHDVMHLYGFDEPSGNFQVNNYGRGGGEGDYVRAEAADGGGTNNANFSTPAADSGTPRMQMYLWPGNQFGSQNQVTVDGLGSFNAGWARFTPPATVAGLPGHTLVYAGTGCAAADYPPLGPTTIVVVDGGTAACSYLLRAQTAEAAGAQGVVIVNTSGSTPILSGSMVAAPVSIPVAAVSDVDGAAIKAAIAGGPTTGNLHRNPAHPGIRDGDLDAGIVIHEYAHGVSNRLTGGPGVNCLSGDERMGEGWSDYYAMAVLMDEELDAPEQPRGLVPYALFQPNRQGNGLRPRPYSTNMNIQPFTYDMIKTNGWLGGTTLSTPHGVGHTWAATLLDMTWDLIKVHGFNQQVYDDWSTGGNNLALQLVTDGLKIQGCGPGFVVGRDAIIAADLALTGGENYCTIFRSFARRGLGLSAIQGTTNRNDNTQAFDLPQDCVRNQSRMTLLLGENEPGGGDTDGSGDARISWDQSGKVCFDIRVRDIGTITGAHIHSGTHGVNGPIVVNFDYPNNGLKGCVTGVSPDLLKEIRTSPTQYYINVHTTEFPGGAIRSQMN